ncbi:MAG: ribonuclease P protein component [Muribaculaceae bacterium]|nr:ribonuclease P protein component [Muribaculaceae bacterium]MDE6551985.1 ribonuclease P protein component [Muribaculaceae bacterium]
MTDTEHLNHIAERFTLRKSAKLRHRTLVQELFQKGKSVYSGPLRVTFRILSEDDLKGSFREDVPDLMGPVQFMITVPKKKRRHAVDRVLMRRRIREAFRLQWHPLREIIRQDPDIRTLSLAIVYMDTANAGMDVISSAVGSALSKIRKKLYPQPKSDNDC